MERYFYIDNILYKNEIGDCTIFQACSNKSIDLPCFCYHEELSIAGNCRMCLVEVSNSLKLVVSCAMPIVDDIKIYTNNKRVKKARESVLEFLLINHPLDCPICDQGGECDLQDITLVFGSDRGRYYEYTKRAVFDRECGPLIKMLMTRCIHCTRCIRFLTEIAGSNDFGMLGRGEDSEIGTYINNKLIDELSGNIIDLCPVGALTSKPYSFMARPWELMNMESIDILDSMCSNIRIDYLNNKIYRVLPIYNKNINEDWMTNKARFCYDSNINQRINYPLLKINNNYVNISFKKALDIFIYFLKIYKKKEIYSIFGMFTDLILVKNMLDFFSSIGTEVILLDTVHSKMDFRYMFISENFKFMFEDKSDILLLGLNIRLELPLLNSRIRKSLQSDNNIKIYSVGLSNSYNNIPIISIGNSIIDILNIAKGKSIFNKNIYFENIHDNLFFFKFKKLNIMFNINIHNIYSILEYIEDILDFLKVKINVIYRNISLSSIFEMNTINNRKINFKKEKFLFLENFDDVNYLKSLNIKKSDFVVYHGHHFDAGANFANLLFPANTFYEYTSRYISLEGRIRNNYRVISSNNVIKNYELFSILKLYNNLNNNKFSIFNMKILSYFDFLICDWSLDKNLYKKGMLNRKIYIKNIEEIFYFLKNDLLNSSVFNYYKTDVYSLNSKNMHLSSLEYLVRLKSFI